MRIAFHAPLKPPNHPRPSGDRRIARLFMRALTIAGHEAALASELRTWEGDGDAQTQVNIEAEGKREAARLIQTYQRRPATRPQCWFTYHLYHKAPDWVGPAVCDALQIPYIAAEASVAAKQKDGAWAAGYAQALLAIRRADLLFNLNSNDLPGIKQHARGRIVQLKPFAEIPPARASKPQLRAAIAARYGVDADAHWLLAAAMMRGGDKLQSYRYLADALPRLRCDNWRLLVAGDGPAEAEVRQLFAGESFAGRAHFLGRVDGDAVYDLMRAADLFVWPAYNEAFGMAVLEALACGLPTVAGRVGGVGDIVADGVTGRLVAAGDADGFAAAVDALLASPGGLQSMAEASPAKFRREHELHAAAAVIGDAVARLV